MTTTTTSDVYYDDVSTYVVSGEKQQGNNSGTTSGNGDSKKPNGGDYLDNGALHTIEHLFATYLRNSESADDIVYFGPMGCRTGCYLLVFGEKTPEDVLPSVLCACDFTLAFDGEIPGAQAAECGNWLEHNHPLAKYYAARYKAELLEHRRFTYPEKQS